MKKEVYDNEVIFEINSLDDLKGFNFKKLDKPYTIRHIQVRDEYTFMTISVYNIDSEMLEKTMYKIDSNDNEVQCIEYDKNDNIIRRTEYENYPSGEIKRLHSYDDKNNLIYEEFYDEDD